MVRFMRIFSSISRRTIGSRTVAVGGAETPEWDMSFDDVKYRAHATRETLYRNLHPVFFKLHYKCVMRYKVEPCGLRRLMCKNCASLHRLWHAVCVCRVTERTRTRQSTMNIPADLCPLPRMRTMEYNMQAFTTQSCGIDSDRVFAFEKSIDDIGFIYAVSQQQRTCMVGSTAHRMRINNYFYFKI